MSSNPTIEYMNVAIAKFEGRMFYGVTIDKFGGNTANAFPEMKYHRDWKNIKTVWNYSANSIGIAGYILIASWNENVNAAARYRQIKGTGNHTVYSQV